MGDFTKNQHDFQGYKRPLHFFHKTCLIQSLSDLIGDRPSSGFPCPNFSTLLCMMVMFLAISSALYTPLPETIRLAPAFAAMSMVLGFTPPSTSMSRSGYAFRKVFTFSIHASIKD